MNRFKYVSVITEFCLVLFVGSAFFGVLYALLHKELEGVKLAALLPGLWYFSVIDALLFGNYPVKYKNSY